MNPAPRWVLVRRNQIQLIRANLGGSDGWFLPVASAQADAIRLAKYLTARHPKPDKPAHFSPADVTAFGQTIEDVIVGVCEDPAVRGVAFLTHFNEAGRPVYTVALCGSRVKPKP